MVVYLYLNYGTVLSIMGLGLPPSHLHLLHGPHGPSLALNICATAIPLLSPTLLLNKLTKSSVAMDFHLVPRDSSRNYTGFLTKTIVYSGTLVFFLACESAS